MSQNFSVLLFAPRSFEKSKNQSLTGFFLTRLLIVEYLKKLLSHHSLYAVTAFLITFLIDSHNLFTQLVQYHKLHPHRVHFIWGIIIYSFIHGISEYIKKRRPAALAKAAGLFYCSTNCTRRQKKSGEHFLQEIGNQCSEIYILCATGYNTFSSPTAPLYNVLKNHQCHKLMVALLDPESDALTDRASHIGKPANEYRANLELSIEYLETIRKQPGKDVELKVYRWYPFWKLIHMSPYIWAQQYPSHKEVQESTYYAFQKAATSYNNRSSLVAKLRNIPFIARWLDGNHNIPMYTYMINQFFLIWTDRTLRTYDFENKLFL